MTPIRGIDVSLCQGSIDWEAVKASGVKFALIKAGENDFKDPRFEENYNACRRIGLQIGAYWYCQVTTVEGARAEARCCMKVLSGKIFEYPIYYDIEEKKTFNTGYNNVNAMIQAWHDELRPNKWYSGLYMSRSHIQSMVDPNLAYKYALWVAEWGSHCYYDGDYGMWQYSSEGEVDGINGRVDCDLCSKPYPDTIINGGWNNNKASSPAPAKKTNKQIAEEVWQGKWGNGADRKKRLTDDGYDYNTVQKLVDEMANNYNHRNDVRYVVKAGDTLSEIAQKFNTTYQKIAADNGIKNPNLIYAGQVLKIYK